VGSHPQPSTSASAMGAAISATRSPVVLIAAIILDGCVSF
jgi:hypothetical protein